MTPKATNLQIHTLIVFFSPSSFPIGEIVLISDFNAQTSSHQGQDFHLDANGINMLDHNV